MILDIDGTIWDTTEIAARAWNSAAEKLGVVTQKITAAALKKEFGKTMSAIARDLWPGLSEEDKSRLMAECCAREQKAVRENERDISYPSVIQTIKTLSARVPFYIVSNCHAGYVELTLSKTGLGDFIKDFECYGRTGQGKAANLRALIERNKIKRALYVGDTQGDCDACAEAGVEFAWASYGFGEVSHSDFTLDSFARLEEILR